VLTFVVPPEPPIDPLSAGSYTAPTLWDDEEWASPTPCHVEWVTRRIAELAIEGRIDVRCPVCDKGWEVICDPHKAQRGHAIWVE
jgi:hypothetical protein